MKRPLSETERSLVAMALRDKAAKDLELVKQIPSRLDEVLKYQAQMATRLADSFEAADIVTLTLDN